MITSSSSPTTVGEAAIVDNDVPFCMGQDVSLIRSVSEQPLFLLHTLRSRVMLAQLETLMVGSTFKRINVGQIKKLAARSSAPTTAPRGRPALATH